MPSPDSLSPAKVNRVVDIVSSGDVAARTDLLRQSVAESAGALHELFSSDDKAESYFPRDKVAAFEERLGYSFPPADRWLLLAALTHKSFMAEAGPNGSADRLAWVGDAKLYDVVGEALLAVFPAAPRATLTTSRSARIKRTTLSSSAKRVGIDEMLLVGRSFKLSNRGGDDEEADRRAREHLSPSMLGEAYEAVLGAVALSGGGEAVRRCYFKGAPLPTTMAALVRETSEAH